MTQHTDPAEVAPVAAQTREGHSPLPWRVNVDDFHRSTPLVDVVGADDFIVAEFSRATHALNLANAQLIVHRVQAHDALVAALQAADVAINPVDREGISLHEWNSRLRVATSTIRAALALAQACEVKK